MNSPRSATPDVNRVTSGPQGPDMSALTARVDAGRARPLAAFGAMMVRDVRVLRREMFSAFLPRIIMQPLLFVFVFAYVMPQLGAAAGGMFGGAGAGGPSFATILVPGMVASSTMLAGMMSVTFSLMMELGWTKEITDRLLAPLPVWGLALQKITSGALQALVAGIAVFPIVLFLHADGQGPDVSISNWPVFVIVMLLTAVLSASLGLLLGTVIDPRKAGSLMGVVMLPAAMLGCVYYPWAALEQIKWLQTAVLVNPIVYASEGLRASLTPSLPHMSPAAFLTVLTLGTALCCWFAVRSFVRRVLD